MPTFQLVESPGPTAIEGCIEAYVTSCRARGLAPGTIVQVTYSLRSVFLPWTAQQGLTETAELTPRVLERLAVGLLTTGGRRGPLARQTVRTYLRAVNLTRLEFAGGSSRPHAGDEFGRLELSGHDGVAPARTGLQWRKLRRQLLRTRAPTLK